MSITLEYHSYLITRLQTIKGIGKRPAMTFVVITYGFTQFANSKQIYAFLGLRPRIFESGTSVNG